MKMNNILFYFKKISKICLYAVALVLAMELGLQLKSWLENYSQDLASVPSGTGILMIGDSVMGNAGESGTVYEQLNEKIKNKNLFLIDESSKANYSAQANFNIDEAIKKYHPKVSIVLLGGSDQEASAAADNYSSLSGSINCMKNIFYKTYLFKMYVSLTSQAKVSRLKNKNKDNLKRESRTDEALVRQKQLYELYFKGHLNCTDMAKLGELTAVFYDKKSLEILKKAEACRPDSYMSKLYIAKAYRELNETEKSVYYFNQALENNPYPEIVYTNLFWVHYAAGDCKGMFSSFEDFIKISKPARTMIWALRKCFVEENKYQEGVEYFKNLPGRSKSSKNLSLLLSESLIQDQKDISHPFLESLEPGDNDYYLSLLLYYKMNSMNREANELYKNKDLYISSKQEPIDLKNFRELIGKLTKNNSKVLVLQYPNQPDWQVLEAIAPFYENVKFISLSSVFEKNLDKQSILDLLSNDFVHVSPLGAGLIADELSAQIKSMLNYGETHDR